MSRIESLTEAQISRLVEFRDRWIQIGLCTDPADRPRAEAAIRDIYRQGGLEPPAKIIWCGSPLSLTLTRAIILDRKLMKEIGDSVRNRVWNSVLALPRDSISLSVWVIPVLLIKLCYSVGDSLWVGLWVSICVLVSVYLWVMVSVLANTLVSIGHSIRRSRLSDFECDMMEEIGGSVRPNVGNSVRDSIRDSIGDDVEFIGNARARNDASSVLYCGVYGAHDAAWLAVYRCFYEVLGLTAQTAKLSGLWELAESAGWALPHRNICWVSARHHILCRDDRGRLHSLAGPACAYPDGWAIYAVHGVRVPRFVNLIRSMSPASTPRPMRKSAAS